jgi:hypothetical protein
LINVCHTSAFDAFFPLARIDIMMMKKNNLLQNFVNAGAHFTDCARTYTCSAPPSVSQRGRSLFNTVVPNVAIPPSKIIIKVACHRCGTYAG